MTDAVTDVLMGGTRLVAFDALDSTNLEAMRRAAMGETGPLWITAQRQTEGRGRSGRGWVTGSGDLAATYVWSTACAPVALNQLSLVAGVAVHQALAQVLDTAINSQQLRLKWPNDVLIGSAKLAGILVETSSFGDRVVAAIGIGVNVAHAPAGVGRTTTRLAAWVPQCSPRSVLHAIDRSLCDWLQTWQDGAGFSRVRERWLAQSIARGTPIKVHIGDKLVTGTYDGLDVDGSLLLLEDGAGLRRIRAGDVDLTTVPT